MSTKRRIDKASPYAFFSCKDTSELDSEFVELTFLDLKINGSWKMKDNFSWTKQECKISLLGFEPLTADSDGDSSLKSPHP